MKTLNSLYVNHQGKVSDKWANYLEAYNQHFLSYKNKPIRLLEIGIQNGGSLEIWSQYFEQAEALVGCDINPDCIKLKYDDARIAVVVADANLDNAERDIILHSSSFDIVIDDGSHHSGDIVRTFARYFKHLNEDGLFVAEDLHCSYWAEFDGGCYDPYSSLSFFKKLVDITNFEHWSDGVSRVQFLDGFSKKYSVEFSEELLSTIQTVEFSNSLCFIRKCAAQENTLGKRIIAGQQAEVVPSILDLGNTVCPVMNQEKNTWGVRNRAIEARYFSTLTLLSDAEQHIVSLSQAVAERDNQILGLNRAVAERDNQILGLNRAVAERDNQILGLNQAVAERDNQILRLNQAVAERDNQILGLNQAVAERDNQILGLNQAVAERDNQIVGSNRVVAEYNDKMLQMWLTLQS